MKRTITLAAALCLALTVSACGQTVPAGASAGTADSASPQESAPETGREKQTTLSMELEGQTEEVPATLYEGRVTPSISPTRAGQRLLKSCPRGPVTSGWRRITRM